LEKNNPTTVTIEGKPYNYDYISGAETTQEDIFHIVGKPVALAWLEGRNRERLRIKYWIIPFIILAKNTPSHHIFSFPTLYRLQRVHLCLWIDRCW